MLTLSLNWLKQNPIWAFFLLTFLMAWSIWLPLGFFFPAYPFLSLPGAWAPTVAAHILIGLTDGQQGIRTFWRTGFRWRVGLGWYLVALFGIAAIAYMAIGLGGLIGIPAPELSLPNGLPREALIAFLPFIFLINIFMGGPLAEDIGWRGYILPKMYEHMSVLKASLIIGVVWAIWHLPFFIFPAWNSVVGNTPFVWFALLTTSWSVLFAWIYVNTKSVLMPVLFHAAINTTLGTLGVLGQPNGSLSIVTINTALTWLVAGAIVLFFGNNLKGK